MRFSENDVQIGNNVIVESGLHLWDWRRVLDGVFIDPNVSFFNDKSPTGGQHPAEYLRTIVGEGASIGAAAVILAGISIREKSIIGTGTVVTRSVSDKSIFVCNPARVMEYAVIN